MTATVTETETFPSGTPEERVKRELALRMKAGAVDGRYEGSMEDGWLLTTIWEKRGTHKEVKTAALAGTFKTTETFPAGVSEKQMKREAALRLKAGAVNSYYEGDEDKGWELITTWNIIGEQ